MINTSCIFCQILAICNNFCKTTILCNIYKGYMYILSQILALVADCLFAVSMLAESRKKLLVGLIVVDVIFSLHYFLLSAWTGGAILIADIAFLITNYFLDKYKKEKYRNIVSIGFVVIVVFITCFTWAGWTSLYPMVGMGTYFICMGQKRLFFSKIGGGARNLCNIAYLICVASYLGAVLEVIQCACAIIGSINDYKKANKDKKASSV